MGLELEELIFFGAGRGCMPVSVSCAVMALPYWSCFTSMCIIASMCDVSLLLWVMYERVRYEIL